MSEILVFSVGKLGMTLIGLENLPEILFLGNHFPRTKGTRFSTSFCYPLVLGPGKLSAF